MVIDEEWGVTRRTHDIYSRKKEDHIAYKTINYGVATIHPPLRFTLEYLPTQVFCIRLGTASNYEACISVWSPILIDVL